MVQNLYGNGCVVFRIRFWYVCVDERLPAHIASGLVRAEVRPSRTLVRTCRSAKHRDRRAEIVTVAGVAGTRTRLTLRCSLQQGSADSYDLSVTEMQQQSCLGLSVEHRTKMHKQVVEAQHPSVPIEAHGCCSALCLLWLRLWAAWAHGILLPKWWDGFPKLSTMCTTAAAR